MTVKYYLELSHVVSYNYFSFPIYFLCLFTMEIKIISFFPPAVIISSTQTLHKLSPFRMFRCNRHSINFIFLDKYLPEPSKLLQSKQLSSVPAVWLSSWNLPALLS